MNPYNLPDRFSVYVENIEQAKFITEKQQEFFGGSSPIKLRHYYRFCFDLEDDRYGYSFYSYLKGWSGNNYNITTEYTFDEFKAFFDVEDDPIGFSHEGELGGETVNYHQVIKQTREERMAMYMGIDQEEIAKMLVNCNEILDSLKTAEPYTVEAGEEEGLGEKEHDEIDAAAIEYVNKHCHSNSGDLTVETECFSAGAIWMRERLFTDKTPQQPQYVPYQCCPVCNGSGKIPSTGTVTQEVCPTCNGARIIPMHVINYPSTTNNN